MGESRPNVNKGKYMERGLPAKLLRLYGAVGNERLELTRAQLCAHFGCSVANLSMAVIKLADEGLLETVKVVRRPVPGQPKAKL